MPVLTVANKTPRPRGRQLPPGWREKFLAEYERTGAKYHSAKVAGIDHDTVVAHQRRDPDFDKAVLNALEIAADAEDMNLHRLARDKDNVVASIVRLKRFRPREYIEQASIAVNVNVAGSVQLVADPTSLLSSLLTAITPTTRRALLPAHDAPSDDIIDGTVVDAVSEHRTPPPPPPPAAVRNAGDRRR